MRHWTVAALTAVALATGGSPVVADELPWWWDEAWWEEGKLYHDVPNHEVTVEWIEYDHEDVTIPAMVARPQGEDAYPAVIWAHGRRGLDRLNELNVKRLAARGFVVMAPDLYSGRFISAMPVEHDEAVEGDLDAGLDVLLARDDILGNRACAVSLSRGGYYTLRLAVIFERQAEDLVCYVGYYPHLQHPHAPEPDQVYRYAGEVNELTLPALILVGEEEQYQRKRNIESAVDALKERERDVRLIVYPGVGRGFDFRGPEARSFADDLATRDAILRTTGFLNHHLRDENK